MDVSATGAGLPNLDSQSIKALADTLTTAAKLPALSSSTASPPQDSVASSLGNLATPSIQRLLEAVDTLLSQAGLQSVGSAHGSHAAIEARSSAEKSVAQAALLIAASPAGHNRPIPDGLNPHAVLTLANQFIESGQVPGYLRAAELGRVVISWYEGPFPGSMTPPVSPSNRGRAGHAGQSSDGFFAKLKNLWRRAPLLILLIAWLLAGLIPGLIVRMVDVPAFETALPFDIWALGFLVLVAVQFILTIRRSAFRRRY